MTWAEHCARTQPRRSVSVWLSGTADLCVFSWVVVSNPHAATFLRNRANPTTSVERRGRDWAGPQRAQGAKTAPLCSPTPLRTVAPNGTTRDHGNPPERPCANSTPQNRDPIFVILAKKRASADDVHDAHAERPRCPGGLDAAGVSACSRCHQRRAAELRRPR